MTIYEFVRICGGKEGLKVGSKKKIRESAGIVEKIAKKDEPVYGINTSLGALCQTRISEKDLPEFQKNIILSHACGYGDLAPRKIAKGALLLLINSLSCGYSGIREETFDMLVDLYNADIIPAVPSMGSVGASGDLAPMAHLASVLLGKGEVFYGTFLVKGDWALRKIKKCPLTLKPKEALSLLNGTYLMTSYAAFAVWQAEILLKTANIIATASLEALKGTDTAFAKEIHDLKPHCGQIKVAQILRQCLKDSQIIASHKRCCRVQDPYSLRCIPQVHGPVLDAIDRTKRDIQTEMNAITDNPLIFPDGSTRSGGNFQGYQIALASDYLKNSLAGLANISFQRIDQLMRADHLSPFLSQRPGLDSGLMMPQVACGSLLTELKILAQPASIHNVPLSAGQEDFNSMGTISARQAYEMTKLLARIVATEMLAAILALEFLMEEEQLLPGIGAQSLRDTTMHLLSKKETLLEKIEGLERPILDGTIIGAVESALKEE